MPSMVMTSFDTRTDVPGRSRIDRGRAAACSMAERAADDGRLETAKRIAETALSAARKAEDDELVKKATLRWLELQ